MQRCVIICGAEIINYEEMRTYLRPDDFIVCCDSGLRHLNGFGIKPDLIIGDFDSSDNPQLPVETIVLPREKDDTDSMAAAREMTKRGFNNFLLLGVFGGRLDHTLGNVYVLLWLSYHGGKALAVDNYSEMEIVKPNTPTSICDCFPYFSLVAIAGKAEGISIKNAKYDLENAEIAPEYQYGVSNEPLPGQTTVVSLKKGVLLLIRDRLEKL